VGIGRLFGQYNPTPTAKSTTTQNEMNEIVAIVHSLLRTARNGLRSFGFAMGIGCSISRRVRIPLRGFRFIISISVVLLNTPKSSRIPYFLFVK
jgi:hypothetical protein